MSGAELIRELIAGGFLLSIGGDKLRVRGINGDTLSDKQREAIREHKAEIMRELRREGPPYPDGCGKVKCSYCGMLRDGVMCTASGTTMNGISLLRECSYFGIASR